VEGARKPPEPPPPIAVLRRKACEVREGAVEEEVEDELGRERREELVAIDREGEEEEEEIEEEGVELDVELDVEEEDEEGGK